MSAVAGKAGISDCAANASHGPKHTCVLRLHVPWNRRTIRVGKKGAHHGARHQYFSNHFSRSSDGDGLRGLGHVQESFVTKMVSSSVASKAAMKADIASA